MLLDCAMKDPIYMRQEIENQWRERVNAAEEKYHRARAEADAALERCGCDATSAEIEVFIQTRSRESAALDEFMRLLKIFHDLAVAGKGTCP